MMTSRHIHIVGPDPMSRRMLCKVSTIFSLEPLSQAKRLARFILSSQASIFLSMIGIFAGIYACSTSALAEIEEDFNQEVSEYGYNISSLSNDVITKLFIDNYIDDDVAIYLSNLGSSHDHGEFVGRNADDLAGIPPAFSASTNSRGFDNAFIPETVSESRREHRGAPKPNFRRS